MPYPQDFDRIILHFSVFQFLPVSGPCPWTQWTLSHVIFNGSKTFFDVYELLGQVFSFRETEEFWKHQDIKIVKIEPSH